jgi:hypothetical protein
MYRSFTCLTIFGLATMAMTTAGCSRDASTTSASRGGVGEPPSGEQDGLEHAHASEGPHGGTLIELGGSEAYHAELVHDDAAGTVTVHILDSSAKSDVAIDAAEITINVNRGGQRKQFKVAAAADPGDPAGQSSRFVSSDPELAEDLDHEGIEARLVINIDGKQYRGAIDHDHGHHEH